MLATALLFAAESAEEVSKAPFYIAAGALCAFTVLLAGYGIARHETFPPSKGLRNALILVCLVLVAAAGYTSVITG
jgi:hypothetical protein